MIFTLVRHSAEFFCRAQRFEISVEAIAFKQSKFLISLFIETREEKNLRQIKEVLRNFRDARFNIESVSIEKKSRKGLRLIAVGSGILEERIFRRKKLSCPIKIPLNRPIGYKEYIKIIHSLGLLPGIYLVEEGKSSQGVPIYSIEHTYTSENSFFSHFKLAIFKPTFFINCRHHANEVSSTNAGLKLSYLLATDPQYGQLLKKVNVVINPMENVDGVIGIEEMLRLTPKDKLHAGRYNWAGREYYEEYFNPETPFGEARVKPNIWKRWIPDICVDNHGFPSHEWEQPFSGYSPFRFREWWIPKAFFFIYLPFIEEKKGSKRRECSEKLGRWLSSFLLDEERIIKRNQTFAERYWKYRGAWISRTKRMGKGIFSFPLQKRFRKNNFSYRYPSITSIEFITEVADEVTYGRFLRECVKAHLETNLSVIRLLSFCHFSVNKNLYKRKEGVAFFWHRERGLTFPQK